MDGWWCLGGDFNTTKNKKEIIGKNNKIRTTETTDFNEFIDLMELINVPSIGGRFTWSNKEGSARSRLDILLLSKTLIDNWKIVGQLVGEKDISDHSPIWLKSNEVNWGPKSIVAGLNIIFFCVEHSWKKLCIKGKQAYVMKEKLKLLRNILRIWNKETFGWLDLKVKEASTRINSE